MPHYSPMLWTLLLLAATLTVMLIVTMLFLHSSKMVASKTSRATGIKEVTWKW